MLAYILAIAVAVSSLALYLAAFFFPEVHRKNDFIWSGVGLFYALVLWVCAGRITGGVLLGQLASVALLGWLGWETLTLRRSLTPAAQQTAIPSPEALQELTKISPQQRVTNLFANLKETVGKVTGGKSKSDTQTTPPPAPADSAKSPVTVVDNRVPDNNQPPVPPAPPQSQLLDSISGQEVVDEVTVEELAQEAAPQTDLDDLEPKAAVGATESATSESEAPEPVLPNPPAPVVERDNDLEPQAAVEATESATSEAETLEPVRPNPPDPELVEAALEDAEEKHIPASPPPTSEETSASEANQPLENPPNPT
ncbi:MULTISPECIES: Ycf66 family protein [Cyanophyceae]|uniref:Ycf66 family protein n=1 Tax=Cyanophyceae TaxID=3028117 RepID=UPI001688F7E5|nr:Ycf66 family protein [Trichocoleus sp. FACHB-40]MBD2003006.1 hypothetical protein [Trichocoleus sp. FACHB-40]